MQAIKLKVMSSDGVEATIQSDGSQSGKDDYYAVVTVKGFIQSKKVYGIDPIQSFTLGLKLIEQLTEAKRIGEDGEEPMNGVSWRIEVDTD
jgi:hypothetical protein